MSEREITETQDAPAPKKTAERKKPGPKPKQATKPRSPNRDGERNQARPPRVPMGSGNKLSAPLREGYKRYWAITGPDHPGKLEQMKAAWWEIVAREDGTDWTVAAGKGNTHVLMEIPQQYYDEDMTAQQKRNIDTDQGKLQALGDSEYVPMGQKNVVERDII
jgi:hypothetical protein